MLASLHHNTPPPLSGRESSVESTPVSTPISAASHSHRRNSREADLLGTYRKPHPQHSHVYADDTYTADELLFPSVDDDNHLPLFPTASPLRHPTIMSSAASPIDIRQGSNSPRNQQSNLTSQFQQPRIDVHHDMSMDGINGDDAAQKPRQESVGMLSSTPFGARSIPRNGQRRGSNTNGTSGSYMGGMSWGGMSMSSFIRDDIMMGTSPNNFGSPSLHSSSYLPKMEATYMKNYQCCDIRLENMHELLQHYEEAHAQQPTQTMGRTPRELQFPSGRATNPSNTAQAVQQQSQTQPQTAFPQPALPRNQFAQSPLFSGQSADQIGTFDNLDDMDMDDGSTLPQLSQQRGSQFQPQPQFGRQQPRGPSVNVNLANAFQGQGLNSATPSTPHAHQQGFQHNPTVSSVNTPTLGTQTSMSQQNSATPDSSMPGTPAEPDFDYNSQMANLNIDYQMMQNNSDFTNASMNNGVSGTIDDPAKRLLSKQTYGNKTLANQSNSELAKRVREQQLLNGLAGAGGFISEEIKPFKCPVIGCEKAYKNQNGLKYHKQHGHQNQQLKENPDGTFSIVDPTTSIPYPGTMGMEKEKPYRCEVCGKRYKNLNGLKYHRQHSPQCNPELNVAGKVGLAGGNLPGANVAGAGLMGMGADGLGY